MNRITNALAQKAKSTLAEFLNENSEFVVNMNNGLQFKHYGEHYRITLDNGKINVFRRCFSDIHDTFIGTIDR
jgi:hypothetical protein